MESSNKYSTVHRILSDYNRARKSASRKFSLKILKHLSSYQFSIIYAKDYSASNNIPSITLAPETKLKLPGPEFADEKKYPVYTERDFILYHPEINASIYRDCVVTGGSTLIFSGNLAITPNSFDLTKYVTALESSDLAEFRKQSSKFVFWGKPKKNPSGQTAIRGINLITEHAANYAHFITEVLPRFTLIESLPEFRDYSLILDSSTPKSFVQILKDSATFPRTIHYVKKGERLNLRYCINIEPTAFTPTHHRTTWRTGPITPPSPHSHTFSKPALEYTRERKLSSIIDSQTTSNDSSRLLLVRDKTSSYNSRYAVTWHQIKDRFIKYGFQPYNPASDSFDKQVTRFSKAELIAGEVGAALVNSMFCAKPCTIWCLASYYENADYYYFSNLAQLLGHTLVYFVGPRSISDINKPKEVGTYWISPNCFDDFLARL